MHLRAKFKSIKLKMIAEFKNLKYKFALNLNTCTTNKHKYILGFNFIFRAVHWALN